MGSDVFAQPAAAAVLPSVHVRLSLAHEPPAGPSGAQAGHGKSADSEQVDAFLHRASVSSSGGRTQVVMRLSQSSVRTSNAEAPHSQALLEAPFLATYDASGALVEVDFAEYVPTSTREFLHRLVASLAVAAPSAPQQDWQTIVRLPRRELDVRYVVESVAAGAVQLRRELIGQRKLDNRPGHAVTYEVRTSTGRLTMGADGSGLGTLAVEDVVDVYYKGALAGREHLTLRAERSTSPVAVSLPTTLTEAVDAVHGSRAQRLRFYRMSPDEVRAVVALDVDGAMSAFLAKVDATPSDATFVLKNFVRLRPEASRKVARALNGLAPTAANRARIGFAYSALAAAGHLEAQSALAAVLGESGFNAMNKDRAARSTLSLQQPEPFMAKALWSYRESLPAGTLKQREDRGIVTNIYGALGGFEHGEPTITREVLDTLLAEYHRQSDAVRASALLPALGNTGDFERLWPVFEPLFTHSETVVRRRAYYVFSKAMTESAFALFAERYAQETAATVRLEASAIAAAMPRTPARLNWAREQVLRTPDSVILGRMVRMIGDELGTAPANREALQALLDRPIDDEVRRTIYRYVAPLAKGGK